MRIDVLYRPPLRRWQVWLADDLRGAGHHVRLVEGTARADLPCTIRSILSIERRLPGATSRQFDPVALPPVFVSPQAEPDLTIALDGEQGGPGALLEPLFDEGRGDAALLATVMRDGAPSVRIRQSHSGGSRDIASAIFAIEERQNLSRALDQFVARLVTLLARAVSLTRTNEVATPRLSVGVTERSAVGPLRYVLRAFARKAIGRIRAARFDHWQIGYRDKFARDGRFDLLPHDAAERFLADPMPFERGGRSYIFFEDFAYATRRGVIGMVEIADGRIVAPAQTVLEETFHLSYPSVFEDRDAIYMLPETSAAGRVQLYRADPFPTRWVPDRILVDGVFASDATLVRHDGRWWMFATLSDDGGSTWDALGLFHAAELHGPWVAHPGNPVLIDAGAARPAGAMWHENGTLMRVAQDCRTGYGRGLALCRVDRLDEHGFAQTVVERLGPSPGSGADGAHTWNRGGGLEVIDLHFPSRRHVRAGRHRAALRATGRD